MAAWYQRPAVIAALAFAAGAVVAAVVVFLVLQDDDGDDGEQVTATATAETPDADETPAATEPPGETPRTPPEETPAAGDIDEALEQAVRDEFDADYVGECPEEIPPEGPPQGICSIELHRSDELATFFVGPPFSEIVGEFVLLPDGEGGWSATFIQGPEPGGAELAVGVEAVVYGAGSCLNVREEPRGAGKIESCQIDGTRAPVVEGPVVADGITWWRLEGLGWASAEFLVPAP